MENKNPKKQSTTERYVAKPMKAKDASVSNVTAVEGAVKQGSHGVGFTSFFVDDEELIARRRTEEDLDKISLSSGRITEQDIGPGKAHGMSPTFRHDDEQE